MEMAIQVLIAHTGQRLQIDASHALSYAQPLDRDPALLSHRGS